MSRLVFKVPHFHHLTSLPSVPSFLSFFIFSLVRFDCFPFSLHLMPVYNRGLWRTGYARDNYRGILRWIPVSMSYSIPQANNCFLVLIFQ